MKRDFELIRQLLIFFEEKQSPQHIEVPPIDGYDELTIKYHLVLLHDAGLLRCEPVRSSTSERVIYVLPFDLTWEGHGFSPRSGTKASGRRSAALSLPREVRWLSAWSTNLRHATLWKW